MAVLKKSSQDDGRGKRKGPAQRRWRRSGPWVLTVLIRVVVDWWLENH